MPGSAETIRARGIDAFRADVVAVAPVLESAIQAVASWDDVKLLTVALDRLTRWHRPGLLAIGDAAHAMSPVGGVGINLAIQDAVAAANILAAPLTRGEAVDGLLARVQARRMLPTRLIQGMQRAVQRRIIGRLLAGGPPIAAPPRILRLLERFRAPAHSRLGGGSGLPARAYPLTRGTAPDVVLDGGGPRSLFRHGRPPPTW